MNKNQFRIGILGALIVAILVFSPSAQNASATHLVSTLGSGSTGIAISADGVMSDIDDGVIVIDSFLQVGTSSITMDGDGALSEIISTVALDIEATTGNILIDSVAGDVTITSGLLVDQDVFVLGDDITTTAGVDTIITSTAGTILIDSLAGAVDINAVGATFDVTIDATDDIIIDAGGDPAELLIDTGAVTVTGTLAVTGAFTVASIEISGANPTLNFDDTDTPADDGTISYDNPGGVDPGIFTINVGGVAGVLTLDETGFIELIAGAEIGTVGGDGNTLEIFTESLDAGGTTAGSLTIVSIGEGASNSGDIFIVSDDTGAGATGGILLETGDVEPLGVGAGVIELTASGAVDINAATGLTIDAGTGDLALASLTGAVTIDATDVADDLTLSAGNAVNILADTDEIDLTATAGDIDINALGGVGFDVDIAGDDVTSLAAVLTTIQSTAGDITIDSLGDFDVNIQAGDGVSILADTDEIDLTATAGAVDINANGLNNPITITTTINTDLADAGNITIEALAADGNSGDIFIQTFGADADGGISIAAGSTAGVVATQDILIVADSDIFLDATDNIQIGSNTADALNLFTVDDGVVDTINIGGTGADIINIGDAGGTNVFQLRSTGLDVSASGDITGATIGSVGNVLTIDCDTETCSGIDTGNIDGDAAITFAQLEALADGNILVGSGVGVATSRNPTGDVDISNTGVFSISNNVIVPGDLSATLISVHTDQATPDSTDTVLIEELGVGLRETTLAQVLTAAGGFTDVTGTALDNAKIWIGSVGNVAAEFGFTGDITLSNGGLTAIANNVIVPGDLSATLISVHTDQATPDITDTVLIEELGVGLRETTISQLVGLFSIPIASIETDATSVTTVEFADFTGQVADVLSATETAHDNFMVSENVVFTNLHVVASGDVGAGGDNYDITLRDDGVDDILTCQITGAGATEDTCTDATVSNTIAQGSILNWEITPTDGGTLNAVTLRISVSVVISNP